MSVAFHRKLLIILFRPFSRPRARLTALRLVCCLVSVGAILVLLTRRSNQHFSERSAQESNVIAHPLVSGSEQLPHLSANVRQLFYELNPVVKGWGEMGEPVYLTNEDDQRKADEQFKRGAFNVFISDRISPNRSLPDPRPYECSKIDYSGRLNQLGTASIVIIFTDEIWSALIRTVWSVWNRTPDVLLKEIILVDDFSTRRKNELGKPLDLYFAHYFGDRVKILRTSKREGLIRARIAGAKKAEGDVLIFLDSHCEVTVGWIEPLLQKIHEDRKNVVCPVIDVIGDKTLDYSVGNPYYFQVGGFTWSGHFTWIDIPDDYTKNHPTKAVASPTMAGGLFAINKDYFFEIGAYDEAMEIWGGENLEMSFRIWQCGGNLLIHPCSHVGHIFRDYHPYSFQGKDTHGVNTLRTILVWMDAEFHRYFFMYRNDLQGKRAGDLRSRFKLKNSLHCKSFQWYLDEVYKGTKFIYDKDVRAFGYVRNPMSNLCFDILNRNEEKTNPLGVFMCAQRHESMYTNQVFSFTNTGEIRREETCMIANAKTGGVDMAKCVEVDVYGPRVRSSSPQIARKRKRQTWIHTKGGQIKNVGTGECLSAKNLMSSDDIKVEPCDPNDLYQLWWFQTYTDIDIR